MHLSLCIYISLSSWLAECTDATCGLVASDQTRSTLTVPFGETVRCCVISKLSMVLHNVAYDAHSAEHHFSAV
jgi:hypothetical protein